MLHPSIHPSLTVEAILVQVLLDLIGREAAVLGDAKVGQNICRLFGVCDLHPRLNGEASGQKGG